MSAPSLSLLSIVIPARNEEEALPSTISHLHLELELQKVPHEIVVVDDGSTDRTWEVLQAISDKMPELHPIRNEGKNGFGRAIQLGLREMRGDAVVIMMADESDDCRDVVRYWEVLNTGVDCVFGSRFMRSGGAIDYPWVKLFLNRIANLFIRILFHIRLNDTTNAFKAYRRKVIEGVSPILATLQHHGRTATKSDRAWVFVGGGSNHLEKQALRSGKAQDQGDGKPLPLYLSVRLARKTTEPRRLPQDHPLRSMSSTPRILVTGSSGLIGSEVSVFFSEQGCELHGVDNNQRAVFFGPQGDTRWNEARLRAQLARFHHHELDIRDRTGVLALVDNLRPECIIHTAAQPSHDRAAAIPFDDFDTNATGTLNLLEAARRFCPEAPFIHMSTNKVYGDRPNTIALRELETRWDYADPAYESGISEDFPIDQSKHSLFGASKLASDVLVQEYGRYFGMPTCCLRGGCLTGPNHSGVELHGFLSYLVKCNLEERPYTVFGYGGKQVRDNIHSLDVARFMWAFFQKPKQAEVYNLGGGKDNSCSILEAFAIVERLTGKKQHWSYQDTPRIGDHICYYSDLGKLRRHYPEWNISVSLQETLQEMVEAWDRRLGR